MRAIFNLLHWCHYATPPFRMFRAMLKIWYSVYVCVIIFFYGPDSLNSVNFFWIIIIVSSSLSTFSILLLIFFKYKRWWFLSLCLKTSLSGSPVSLFFFWALVTSYFLASLIIIDHQTLYENCQETVSIIIKA